MVLILVLEYIHTNLYSFMLFVTILGNNSAVPAFDRHPTSQVVTLDGNNYLVEHSAGSGKSNTIGWLAHRLASLHHTDNNKIFDSVIVITDRLVLDKQLQDTIYQFEHKQGVVEKIEENSRQLAEALENGMPIIITTLQKFPFVSGMARASTTIQPLSASTTDRSASPTAKPPTRRALRK